MFLRLSRSHVLTPNDAQNLRRFLHRNLKGAAGLAMISVAAALAAALATWSIGDPSFSHATDAAVENVLGFAGAALSDLLMQCLGLTSILLPVSIAVWGWRILFAEAWLIGRRQVFAWFVGLILLGAAVGTIPAHDSWPLPTGLGGIVGDLVNSLPALFFGGSLAGWPGFVTGTLFGLASLPVLGFALGFLWQPEESARPVERRAAPVAVDDEDDDEDDYDDEDEDEREGSALLGILSHWRLMAGAQLRRLIPVLARRRDARKPLSRKLRSALIAAREAHEDYDDAERIEPHLMRDDNAYAYAPSPAPQERDRDDEPETYAPEWDENPLSPEPVEAPRVQAPAPKPKPGRRLAREAQPSMFDGERFELPSLHLLAEPKGRGKDPALNADALEQNARILEGVLEDFGVRGEIINVRPGPVVTLYELEPAPGVSNPRA